MPRLHGVNASPFVRKVRIALAEKGVDYELVPVMPIGVSDEFRRMSPLGKIPCYEDRGYVLPDSSCICAFLERKVPEPRLYPEDAEGLGRALWYEEYADTRLVESLAPVFVQRVVQAKIMGQGSDEEHVARCLEERVPPVLDYLEGELAGLGACEGVVGGRFGIADLSILSPFVNFLHAGEAVDPSRHPALSAYLGRLLERPSIAGLVAEEREALAAL